MRWLWVLLPRRALPLFDPLKRFIMRQTELFSPPWSVLTLEGTPYFATALRKLSITVLLRLLSEARRNTTNRLYPSMAPWITILHLKQWKYNLYEQYIAYGDKLTTPLKRTPKSGMLMLISTLSTCGCHRCATRSLGQQLYMPFFAEPGTLFALQLLQGSPSACLNALCSSEH